MKTSAILLHNDAGHYTQQKRTAHASACLDAKIEQHLHREVGTTLPITRIVCVGTYQCT